MKIESEKCLKIKKILLPRFAEFSVVRSASFRFDSMLYGFVHKFDGVTVVYKGFTVFNNSWIKLICNNPKVNNFKDDFDDDNNIDEFNDVKNLTLTEITYLSFIQILKVLRIFI